MTDADRPWEPPLAGSEAEQLTAALDRLRTTFRRGEADRGHRVGARADGGSGPGRGR